MSVGVIVIFESEDEPLPANVLDGMYKIIRVKSVSGGGGLTRGKGVL